MKTIADIQKIMFDELGLKTSVLIVKTGSMKGYCLFRPMFQGGEYPDIPFAWTQNARERFKEFYIENDPLHGVSCSISQLYIYGVTGDKMHFKRECKPKVSESNPSWGSKNSQLRLDKAARRYAKRVRQGKKTVRFY